MRRVDPLVLDFRLSADPQSYIGLLYSMILFLVTLFFLFSCSYKSSPSQFIVDTVEDSVLRDGDDRFESQEEDAPKRMSCLGQIRSHRRDPLHERPDPGYC